MNSEDRNQHIKNISLSSYKFNEVQFLEMLYFFKLSGILQSCVPVSTHWQFPSCADPYLTCRNGAEKQEKLKTKRIPAATQLTA